jgi:hypothetical protein
LRTAGEDLRTTGLEKRTTGGAELLALFPEEYVVLGIDEELRTIGEEL